MRSTQSDTRTLCRSMREHLAHSWRRIEESHVRIQRGQDRIDQSIERLFVSAQEHDTRPRGGLYQTLIAS